MNKTDRTKGVWIILAIGMVLGMVLAVYMYIDSTKVKQSQWNSALTDSDEYEISVNMGDKVGGVTYITGYFFKYGESIGFYEPVVKLVNGNGACYEIPTVSVIIKELDEIYADSYSYQNSGFEAMAIHSKMEEGTYRVYLHDKVNDITLDSGVSLEVSHE